MLLASSTCSGLKQENHVKLVKQSETEKNESIMEKWQL